MTICLCCEAKDVKVNELSICLTCAELVTFEELSKEGVLLDDSQIDRVYELYAQIENQGGDPSSFNITMW